METIKERLQAFIEYLDVSVRTFEGKCGLANGYVKSVQSISSDKLVSIHGAYPKLSILWLLFNEGEMLNEVNTTTRRKRDGNETETSADLYERIIEEKDARIKVQEDTIADLRERISELKGDIATPRRSVATA